MRRMHSWTTLTPFYSEDLLYSAKELAAKTEDGVWAKTLEVYEQKMGRA